MEGPTGLWWATILTVTLSESMQTSLETIGWSLAIGFSIWDYYHFIGLSGLGGWLAGLFKPGVLVVFMFLRCSTGHYFFKGMLGLHLVLAVKILQLIILSSFSPRSTDIRHRDDHLFTYEYQ